MDLRPVLYVFDAWIKWTSEIVDGRYLWAAQGIRFTTEANKITEEIPLLVQTEMVLYQGRDSF